MWLIWIVVAVIFGIIELATSTFFIAWFGIGAIVAAILSTMSINLYGQIFIFFVVSIVMLLYTRPIVKRLNGPKGTYKTNIDHTLNSIGIVTLEINPLTSKGQIKVNNEIWSATSADNSVIEVGQNVVIERIKGVTAIVSKVEQ